MCAGKELVELILWTNVKLKYSKKTQLFTLYEQNFDNVSGRCPGHLSRFQSIQGRTLQCGESGYKSDLVENSSKINGNNFLLSMPLREIDNTKKLNGQKYWVWFIVVSYGRATPWTLPRGQGASASKSSILSNSLFNQLQHRQCRIKVSSSRSNKCHCVRWMNVITFAPWQVNYLLLCFIICHSDSLM